jgi:Ca2+-binding EF-hand superfamily protein
MGAVASNAVTYAGMFVPDRDQLVEWGLFDADEEKAIKASKNSSARTLRKLKKEVKPLFKSLNLRERDMDAFMDAYGDVDIDGILSISYSNFCEYFHIIPNKFIEAMFFDFNPEKNMTFQHFVVSTFYYCLATPQQLAQMIFTVYDRANMGKIYPPIVMQLIREMYDKGFRFEPHATMATVKLINTHEKQWGVDEAAFVEILWRHQQPGEWSARQCSALVWRVV